MPLATSVAIRPGGVGGVAGLAGVGAGTTFSVSEVGLFDTVNGAVAAEARRTASPANEARILDCPGTTFTGMTDVATPSGPVLPTVRVVPTVKKTDLPGTALPPLVSVALAMMGVPPYTAEPGAVMVRRDGVSGPKPPVGTR